MTSAPQTKPVPVETSVAETQGWYTEYYARQGADRNSLLHNPGVLFQILAQDAALIRALQSVHADPRSTRVLDVGCGDGAGLQLLLRLGFEPGNLFGVDIQEDRIVRARARNPLVTFQCSDAATQSFADNAFDIVTESALFVHLTDDKLAKQVAREMLRVTRQGGIVLLSDWRYPKPGNVHYRAVSVGRIADLFQVGSRTQVLGKFRGALLPPIGRFLSKHFSSSYFLVHKALPFLAGYVTTVLRKVE